MNISIISASHRINSQSKKISDILHSNLLKINSDFYLVSRSSYEFLNNFLRDVSVVFYSF